MARPASGMMIPHQHRHPGRHHLYLTVFADTYTGGYSNAACQIRVHALTAGNLPFDGGVVNVTAHSNNTWRYYSVNVPANALGWDVRLTNTVGLPKLVVCRDLAPQSLSTITYPVTDGITRGLIPVGPAATSGRRAMTGRVGITMRNGTNRYGISSRWAWANPLEAGSYYVGVFGTGADTNSMSYSLSVAALARPDHPRPGLPFAGGVVSSNGLPPRECATTGSRCRPARPPGNSASRPTAGSPCSWSIATTCRTWMPAAVHPSLSMGAARCKSRERAVFYSCRALLPRIHHHQRHLLYRRCRRGDEPQREPHRHQHQRLHAFLLRSGSHQSMGPVDATGLTDLTVNDALEGGEAKFYSFSVPMAP